MCETRCGGLQAALRDAESAAHILQTDLKRHKGLPDALDDMAAESLHALLEVWTAPRCLESPIRDLSGRWQSARAQ